MFLLGCWGLIVVVVPARAEVDTQANPKTNDQEDEENNEGAPPLEAAAAAGVFYSLGHLLVAFVQVGVGLFRLLLGALDDGALLDDKRLEVLEETGQLDDALLDLLELVVPRAYITQDGGGLT